MGNEAFLDRHFFYSYLKAGHFEDYRMEKDFGRVAVFRREKPKVHPPSSWVDRVRGFATGKLYGVSEALKAVGAIHAKLGLEEEATRQFQRIEKIAEDNVSRIYRLGLDHLKNGRLNEAQSVFERILAMLDGQPFSVKATLSQQIARDFLEFGFFDQAITYGKRAVQLNPASKEVSYDLGLFYLAKGDFDNARETYAMAVEEFGKDPRSADLIQQLIQQGIHRNEATGILNTFFGQVLPRWPSGTPISFWPVSVLSMWDFHCL